MKNIIKALEAFAMVMLSAAMLMFALAILKAVG